MRTGGPRHRGVLDGVEWWCRTENQHGRAILNPSPAECVKGCFFHFAFLVHMSTPLRKPTTVDGRRMRGLVGWIPRRWPEPSQFTQPATKRKHPSCRDRPKEHQKRETKGQQAGTECIQYGAGAERERGNPATAAQPRCSIRRTVLGQRVLQWVSRRRR